MRVAQSTDAATVLSPEQIAFFKDQGYLIVRGLLDSERCQQAEDRMWECLPEGTRLRRDDPDSWIGPFDAADAQDDPMHIRRGHLWQVRSVGTEQLLIDLVFAEPVRTIAEALLGPGMLVPPVPGGMPMGSQGAAWPGGPVDPAIGEGARGIYFTLPYGDGERLPDTSHTDGHPFNLGLVGLIDDVAPDGGGFRVWPGSHRRLYPTFQMQYDQPRVPYYSHLPSHRGIVHSEEYLAELDRVTADTTPVDCWGQRGDVVFWHHRLAHMAGHNYSSTIRKAVLYDFTRTDLDTCRLDPPQADMWRDWSSEVRTNRAAYSEAFARGQNLAADEQPDR